MKFFFLGDMGTGDEIQTKVSNALNNQVKKCKKTFVCGLGDNIYDNGCQGIYDKKFISHFEEPYSNISDDVPFYMCLGNHDYRNYDDDPNCVQYQIDYSDVSNKWTMPNNYYKFRKQQNGLIIDFFMIDTNIDYHSEEEIKKQLNTLIHWIHNSNAHWKIVCGHHTWRSVAGHGNAEPQLESFLTELINKAPFDVYMCGHDHTKQLIQTKINNNDITMIVCGAGGKNYKDIPDNFDNTSDLIFSSHNLGYGLCNAHKNYLDFEFKNEDDQLEFKYRTHKN
jgi:tartrate-resistant acid phosphatase type 5